MTIRRQPRPEEEELEVKKAELAALEEQLALSESFQRLTTDLPGHRGCLCPRPETYLWQTHRPEPNHNGGP